MNPFSFLKNPFLIGGVVIAISLLIFIFINPNKSPKLIQLTPMNGQQKVDLLSGVTLHFDDAVSQEDLSISSNPEEEWTISSADPLSFTAKPKLPFHASTTYQLLVTWKNKQISNTSFTTISSQTDYRLLKEIKDEVDKDYPLVNKTPYETTNLKVLYSAAMTFEITLKNSSISESQAIDQVKSWVSSNGGDADKHQYKVIPFSQ